MSLLREIQEAATGNDVPLAVLLRKCRILAQRLGNDEFRSWVNWELNGYPNEGLLPPYRKESAEVRGEFAGAFGRGLHNAPMPRFHVSDKHMWLFQNVFADGVSRYETLLEANEGSVQSPWPAEAVALYANSFYEGFVCISAWRLVDRGSISGMLNAVRNKVLEFALHIESEAPDAGEALAGTQPVNPERAESIFTNVIYGGHNVIAMAGKDLSQRVSVTEQPEWKELSARLGELGKDGYVRGAGQRDATFKVTPDEYQPPTGQYGRNYQAGPHKKFMPPKGRLSGRISIGNRYADSGIAILKPNAVVGQVIARLEWRGDYQIPIPIPLAKCDGSGGDDMMDTS